MKDLNQLVRANIYALKPYSCARDEFKGEASVYIDANENPENGPYNRYPDPLQSTLKQQIATIKGVRPTQIMLGNGSDEPIDLIFRIFCEPKTDNVVAIEPTYGMYRVCADVNNVEYRSVQLDADFALDADKLLAAADEKTKVIWLCSPNNPSGNLLNINEVRKVITHFEGVVVVDEAYIDFAGSESLLNELEQHPNLIVLQTFSKAWGMAAVRCGMAFASETLIGYFNKVKYPYNVNLLTQQFVSEQLTQQERKARWVQETLERRAAMIDELKSLKIVKKIYHSDANFVLAEVDDACDIYKRLTLSGIVVRNRHTVTLCANCLRITVGTQAENARLVEELKKM